MCGLALYVTPRAKSCRLVALLVLICLGHAVPAVGDNADAILPRHLALRTSHARHFVAADRAAVVCARLAGRGENAHAV